MMKHGLGLARIAIERVLELSGHAQISRRDVAKDSAAFYTLTGAIAAYGKVLAMLTAFQQGKESYEIVGRNPSERVAA